MPSQKVIEDSGSDYDSFDGLSEGEENLSTDTTESTTTTIKSTKEASRKLKTVESHNDNDNDNEGDSSLDPEIERKRKRNNNNENNNNLKAIRSSRPTNKKSPWILFCSEYRTKVMNENPSLQGPEIQQKLAEIYHSLPESEQERYRHESREYRDEINKKRYVRPRNQKLPGNGYIQYTKFISPQIRAEHPEFDMKERNRLIATGWKELGKEGQQKYIDEAKILYEKFIKENPEYYAVHLKRSLAKRKATMDERKLEDEIRKERRRERL